MVHRFDAKQSASVKRLAGGNDRTWAGSGSPLLRNRISRGQAAAEFALIAPVVILVMLVGVQFALIGQAALALSQADRGRALCRGESRSGRFEWHSHTDHPNKAVVVLFHPQPSAATTSL